jgi:hypothetical protein
MKFFVVCLCVLLLVQLMLIIRYWYVQARLKEITIIKYNALKVLTQKLSLGETINEEELVALAEKPSLRLMLYDILVANERGSLFPGEFYTVEKGAESYLANWLEFPTELGRTPDEILLLTDVTFDLPRKIHYYVFKFRSSAPRWANKLGWMLGVCGPYDDESLPFDIPKKTFSRFNPEELITPEAEAQWVHKKIHG